MSFESKIQTVLTKIRTDIRQIKTELEAIQGSSGTASPASETVAGVLRIATQVETTAGISDARAITPLKLQDRLSAFAQPLSTNLTTLASVVSGTTGRSLLGSSTTASAKTVLNLVKADVGLSNVDNTSDANKPVSTAQQTALNLKLNTANAPTKTSLGLDNVDNTSDIDKPVSTAQQTALNLKLDISNTPTKSSLGLGNVTNTSDANKPVSTAQQTALNLKLNIADVPTKVSLGLDNVDNTSDANKPVSTEQQTALNLKANLASPLLTGTPRAPTAAAGTATTQLATTAFVSSATSSAVSGLMNASETESGIIELATQTETDTGTDNTRAITPLKLQARLVAFAQPLSSNLTALSGVVSGTAGRSLLAATTTAAAKTALALVKADVGLSNVDNTSDVNKPVSTAQQTALNLKADTTSIPTKSSLGLSNVDNTSDADKPVSTAQQTALNTKANLSSPNLTGIPTAPTAQSGTSTEQIATTTYVQAAMGDLTSGYLGTLDAGGPVEGSQPVPGIHDGGTP